MTHQEPNILLVEGEGDKFFFEKLLKENHFSDFTIEVLTPTDINSKKDGKKAVISELESYAKERENDKFKDRKLACIVDVDYFANNRTILQELDSLKTELSQYSYDSYKQHETGYYFQSKHSDLIEKGFHNIGIWFMPNNHDEGMFEDWLLKIANDDEKDLLEYADTVCENVPQPPKFKPIHKAKAHIGVWTALQKSPHLGTENIILHKLYNKDSTDFKNFISWLEFIFKN